MVIPFPDRRPFVFRYTAQDKPMEFNMSNGLIDARVMVIGAGGRASARELMLLDEIREKLKAGGVQVVTASDEELAEMANHLPDCELDRVSVTRAEKMMQMFITAPELGPGPALHELCCAQAGAYEAPDRPAWVSPYGPARRRRK
jgi:hypothetical protein